MACGGAPPNPDLVRLYEQDQADRLNGPIDWRKVGPRDQERRNQVQTILKAGGARVSADYYHAAMVFQHGSDVADFQRAHWLALQAVKLDPQNDQARWLAAAARDRELMNAGKPQLYGTQYRTNGDGVWELYEVDPKITDAERARWNVPPLAEAHKRVHDLNAGKVPGTR